MDPRLDIHVAGTGSFALEAVDWAEAAGWRVAALVELLDPARVGSTVHGLPVVAAEDPPEPGALVVVGAGGDRLERWSVLAPHGWRAAPPVIHPSSAVSSRASVGDGSLVGPATVIGAGAEVGEHVLIARGALVAHHVHVGAGCSLYPGANLAGSAWIGERVQVGMSAVIVDHRRVGDRAVVAAGAVVLRDVEPGRRVQGVPARPHEARA